MTNTKLKKKALSHMVTTMSLENCGVYPASLVTEGEEQKRNEFQNGWNACYNQILESCVAMRYFIDTLPNEAIDYILGEKIRLDSDGDEVSMYVPCNDVFAPACADDEDFTLSDLHDFNNAIDECPEDGDILWIARKRSTSPHPYYYKNIDKKYHHLFDYAGK